MWSRVPTRMELEICESGTMRASVIAPIKAAAIAIASLGVALAGFQNSYTQSHGRSQPPGKVPPSARRLAGEPQTAFFRPSPNTPSKASLPPLKQEEVLRRDALLEGVLDPAF